MAVPLWHDLPFGNLSWLAYVWHIVRWRKARAKLMLSGKNCPDKHPETHVTQHHQATISADARKNPLKQTSPGSLLLRLEPWAMESVGSLKWPRRLAEVVRRGRAANLRNCWRDQLTFKRCCGEGSWRGGCRGRCFSLGDTAIFSGLAGLAHWHGDFSSKSGDQASNDQIHWCKATWAGSRGFWRSKCDQMCISGIMCFYPVHFPLEPQVAFLGCIMMCL